MFPSAPQSSGNSSLRACGLILFAVIILATGACVSAGEQAAAETPKLYSPFDEARPKIPAEILSDKRLDKKVTVCVKSTNMKSLFSALRKQTGVSVLVSKELSGERPIIFFHDKSLRDVMTEISALYGYYWLAKGRKNAWTYELFEDILHSKRRDYVRDSQQAAQVDALLDCIELGSKALESDAAQKQFCETHPRLCSSVQDPSRRELLKLIALLDKSTIRSAMSDVGKARSFTDFSTEMQSAVLNTINTKQGKRGGEIPEPWTREQMQSAIVVFKWFKATMFASPHFCLSVSIPATGEGSTAQRVGSEWPYYASDEPDLLSLPETPPGRVIGDSLPDVKITVEKKHEVLNSGAILIQDVLDAIARQANVDIIADYYYQDTSLSACSDMPLDELVADLCLKMGYTCQVEKDALRFKCNKWYLQPLQQEPPSKFHESLWKRLADTGALTMDDLLDIACLPGQQTFWGGFRFIPQAQQARLFPRTARLVRMLGSILEAEASTPKGLSVSKLDAEQFSRITDWAGVMGIKESPEGLLKSTIRIERIGQPETKLQFTLTLPDGTPRNVTLNARLEPFDEKARRTLAEERAAELAADKVELSPAKE